MASAPKPGARRAAEETATAVKLVWVITVRGQEYRLRRGDLGPADARLVRQQTGFRLLDIMAEVGGGDFDYTTVLWWLARRHAGETDLRFAQAEPDFPRYEDYLNDRSLISVTVEVVEPVEDGSPEA